MGEKIDYGVITGQWLSGKTTICKHYSNQGMFIIDSKAIHDDIKKSYEELPEPPESVPNEAITDKIKDTVKRQLALNPKTKFLFDSLHGTPNDFDQVLNFMGTPDYLVYLDASEAARKKRWLVKNEQEEWTEAMDEEVANYPDNSV